MRICLAALGVGVGTMLIAACSGGTATSTAASANGQACATLQSASSTLAEIPADAETVGQAQQGLQSFSNALTAAKAETSGLGQALVTNLQARADEALKSISGLAPTDPVPAGFAAAQSKLGSGLSELTTKLKCS